MDQARLAQEYANLGSIYDPQTALIQQQISQLPTQYEAQKSALEQAKVNAFRDIGTAAQARGTFFSGFRPQEMARYTGEKYLPALANLTTQQQQRQAQLESALQQVGAQRQREATVNLQNILKLEAAQQAAAAQAAAARAPRAYGGGGGYAGGPTLILGGPTTATQGGGDGQSAQKQQQYIGQNDYRGRLSFLAKQGDKDAAVLLKYVGNDGKAGGVIASQSDYNILKQYKIGGNYKLATPKGAAASYLLPGARQIVIPRTDSFR